MFGLRVTDRKSYGGENMCLTFIPASFHPCAIQPPSPPVYSVLGISSPQENRAVATPLHGLNAHFVWNLPARATQVHTELVDYRATAIAVQ